MWPAATQLIRNFGLKATLWRKTFSKVRGTRGRSNEWGLSPQHPQGPPKIAPARTLTKLQEPFTCFSVSLGPWCHAVTAVREDDIVKNIEQQPYDSSTENQQWSLCLLGINIPFDSFNQDAEHQGHGKNGVAKCSHDICPKKAKRALPVLFYTAGPYAPKTNDHGDQVGKDGKSIGGQREGVAYVGGHQLHHEKEGAHNAHED